MEAEGRALFPFFSRTFLHDRLAAGSFQFESLLQEEPDSRGCRIFVTESQTVFLTLPETSCLPSMKAPQWTAEGGLT